MQKQPIRPNRLTGEPIAVYRKSRSKLFLKSLLPTGVFLLFILLILNNSSGSLISPYLVVLMGIVIVNAAFLIWDTFYPRIEWYPDAIVIYTGLRQNVIYLEDIETLSSRPVKSNKFTGYTEYTIQGHDGLKMYFTDEFDAYMDLVARLQFAIQNRGQAI